MPFAPLIFRTCVPLAITLLLASCASYTDRSAESALLQALPKLVGPADSYTATVQGASSDGTRIEQVLATGVRVRRPNLPVFERIELRLSGVVLDAAAKRVTAVGDARLSLRLKVDDVAAYLGTSEWIDRPAVRVSPPDKVFISGQLKIAGIALASFATADLEGRLQARDTQLRLAVDALSWRGQTAPALVRALVEQAINPILNVAQYPLPARIDSAVVEGDAIVITASGNNLMQIK
jgi:LmeA-like phospholipid-binding